MGNLRKGFSIGRFDVEPTKDEIIHALHAALVEMTTRIEMRRELIEMLMQERVMYCAITPREEIK